MLEDKIILVSGANSGIGKATALALAEKGATVLLLCRNQERGHAAKEEIIAATNNSKVELLLCDLASQNSIREFGAFFRDNYPHLDVLVNNAGGIFGKRKLSPEGLEYSFALNHMGYFLLTHELLPALRLGSMKRIVNVSSLAHKMVRKIDWDNIQGEKMYGQLFHYGLSKLFNIYFTTALHQQLKEEQFLVNCLHPGVVNTGFGKTASGFFKGLVGLGHRFLSSPKKGAATSVFLASDPELKTSGAYFSNCKIAKTSTVAKDQEAVEKLWELSMKLGKIETYGQQEMINP